MSYHVFKKETVNLCFPQKRQKKEKNQIKIKNRKECHKHYTIFMIQSDFPVKMYYRLNFLRASIFNFEHLELLRDSIGHPSQKLLSFEFPQSFYFQFWASRIIKGLNPTSVTKVNFVWMSSELLFSILSV